MGRGLFGVYSIIIRVVKEFPKGFGGILYYTYIAIKVPPK